MRRLTLIPALVTTVAVGCSSEPAEELAVLREEVAQLRTMVGPPPSSIDSLYPPVAPSPVLLQEMVQLAEAFTGLLVDVFEQDYEHVPSGLERFRAEYAAVASLVPEWQTAYPTGPVDELAAALEAGDPDRIGAAVEGVGAVCHDCHVANMAKVQYRYRWPDFGMIRLQDPATGRELSYKQLMQEMETAFVGIGVDLRQQQMQNARAQFETFEARLGLLRTACGVCHATERTYFVDASVLEMVQQLGTVLEEDNPDPEMAAQLGQQIGMESCSKCHLVHAPAALYKAQWEAGVH
jgi:cytochrome c556